ncbi:tartrate dehydrogenase [Cohnella hongkongensis]|uniref:D-malate dehydrogenase (decarboxylating) n=1 Tax=Cohnella hongkongensis TaxID=178337 RepID=A0ABV9FJN4_9BACL
MNAYNIAVIPGDGIGKEVVPAALRCLEAVADIHGGLKWNWTFFPWNCEYYLQHGEMMPEDGISTLKQFDQIFLGAVGMPELVPDHISLWGLLVRIRRECEQSINVRPAKLLRGLDSPLRNPEPFDFVVVRENSEGEYSQAGGAIHSGEDELVVQNAIFTRRQTAKAMKYAFELAAERRQSVVSATKSNGIVHSMPFWDRVFEEVGAAYPDAAARSVHIDALCAYLVMRPQQFDVIVASNLFGDILTDLGGAIMGSIGIAPAANLNVERKYPSMFEPVHGSAPDIAGKGIANPIGQIWTAKQMLDFMGYPELGELVLGAIEDSLSAGVKTGDLGGTATTEEAASDILARIYQRGK